MFSFRTENKLKAHLNVCENHEYCYMGIPEKGKNILKNNHGEKSVKILFVIFTNKKVFNCKNRYMS